MALDDNLPSAIGSTTSDKPPSEVDERERVSSDADFLASDDSETETPAEIEEEKEEKPKKVAKSEREEEPESEPEEEKIEAKPDEEYLDRPEFKDIIKAYPDILKKFPALQGIYYRDKEFSRIYASIDEAKEAAEKSQFLDRFSGDLLQGNSGNLLDELYKSNPDSLRTFTKQFLPTLYDKSKNLWAEVTEPLFKNLVHTAFNKGKASNNENLQNAAIVISELLWGVAELPEVQRETKSAPDPKITELENKLRLREVTEANNFVNAVDSSVTSNLRGAIVKDLDPENALSSFVRDAIIDKTFKEVDTILGKDEQHLKYIATLRNRALSEGYSDEIKSKITNAYMTRARKIMPSIRQKYVNEALNKKQPQEKKKPEIERSQATSRRTPPSGGSKSKPYGGLKDDIELLS